MGHLMSLKFVTTASFDWHCSCRSWGPASQSIGQLVNWSLSSETDLILFYIKISDQSMLYGRKYWSGFEFQTIKFWQFLFVRRVFSLGRSDLLLGNHCALFLSRVRRRLTPNQNFVKTPFLDNYISKYHSS